MRDNSLIETISREMNKERAIGDKLEAEDIIIDNIINGMSQYLIKGYTVIDSVCLAVKDGYFDKLTRSIKETVLNKLIIGLNALIKDIRGNGINNTEEVQLFAAFGIDIDEVNLRR